MHTPIYFISDIHLQPDSSEPERRKRARLRQLLERVRRAGATLYIVGDLFDFWFEYRHVIPRHYFSTLRALQELTESGCPVHIIVGNHDYWLGSFFPEELNISVHQHPIEVELCGWRFLITHGDGILKRDVGYRLLKRVLRNRFVIWLFRLIHPDLAFRIARMVSGTSRKLTLRNPGKEEAERREIVAWAEAQFQRGIDAVVMGHYHLPTRIEQDAKVFLNLGDWMRYFSYAVCENDRLTLRYWRDSFSDPE